MDLCNLDWPGIQLNRLYASVPNVQDIFECGTCRRRYINKHCLRNHIEKIHGNNSQALTCRYCNVKYKNQNSLSNHISLYHSENKKRQITGKRKLN
jgi:hypothetical protein